MSDPDVTLTLLDASRIADEAITDFLQAAEDGQPLGRAEFIQQHSDVRSALESFFDAYDQMEESRQPGDGGAGAFSPGGQLGRHRLVRPIGSGAFGTVWLGFDSQLKRPVAIKVPNPNRFTNQKQRGLFLSEAQTVAQLEHSNIVPVYDVGETEAGEIYLVSRFVAGNNLATEMQNRKFTFSETADGIVRIADALDYAHRRNVIHRDIKPSNILIDAVTKQPYVTDFGLACSSAAVEENSVAGTPAYMSPEQASGAPVDHRSDVFSLGAVFYELLYGTRPFPGATANEVMQSVREDGPQRLSETGVQVPQLLQQACFKSLAKPLEDRYDDAAALQSDVRLYLASESVEQNAASSADISRIKNGLRRFLPVAIGVFAVIGGLWLAANWAPERLPETLPLTPKDDQAVSSGPPSRQKTIDREIAEATIELGGHIDVRTEEGDHEVDSIAAIPEGDISLLWVMFDGQTLEDDFFANLSKLDSLEGVDLFDCTFSDSGFVKLAEVKSLGCVHAPSTHVNDSCARALAVLPRLSKLSLTDTDVTNETVRHFEGNKSLTVLRLAGTGVTDEGLKSIGTMTNLQILILDRCRVTDGGVKHLASLTKLQMIMLTGTLITAKSLEYLESCPIIRLDVSADFPRNAEEKFLATHPGCQVIRAD